MYKYELFAMINGMLTNRENEIEILNIAIEAVKEAAGLDIRVKKTDRNLLLMNDIDAIVEVKGVKEHLFVEVKKWAAQANLGAIINQITNLPNKGLLVADHINPIMGDKLRQENVQYIDKVGNAYINMPNIYVFVKGNKPTVKTKMPMNVTGIAFGTAGLRVIFVLLCNPALVGKPYRVIAEEAGVALGTITKIFADLKAMDFLFERKTNKTRQLTNEYELFKRWVEHYPLKLKAKLFLGEFVAEEANWWKDCEVKNYQGVWGGEVAAAIKTRYMTPQITTIYLPEEQKYKLVQNERLRKVKEWDTIKNNTVKLYNKFWNGAQKEELAPTILIYADLIATADTRNLEVADKIYMDYIDGFIAQT